MKITIKRFIKYILLIILFSIAFQANASIINGSISTSHYTAQVCETASCAVSTTSPVNFGNFSTTPASDVVVTDTALKGYIWGESFGWAVLNCINTASGCTSTNNNFKVANDSNGHLSGYAWGQNAGWINFGPFVNSTTSPVVINSSGQFNGYAWSQNYGWIKFDCSNPSYCVQTDWRPQNTRPQCSDGIDNDNDGLIDSADPGCHTDLNANNSSSYDPTLNSEYNRTGGGGFPSGGGNDMCPNIAGVQSTVPDGKILDASGQCVDNICPNTVNYNSVPLSSSGPFTVNVKNTTKIGFAIKVFDTINPAHTEGDIATENALNKNSSDQVVVYDTSLNKYVLGFEDVVGGDYDYNDLVVGVGLSCDPLSGNTCPNPSSLSDTTSEIINHAPSGELDLQTILNNAGYNINTILDQKQYQVWDIPQNTTVTVSTKFINKFAGNSFVFGYYTNGSLANFVPIFKTANIAGSTTVPTMCTPNPSDYCPNINGVQTSLPPGMALNTTGQCVYIVPDVCSNIPGSQLTVPDGYGYNSLGQCVPVAAIDQCPNIVGNQMTVPSGMSLNTQGQCVSLSVPDACPNIPGSQSSIPTGDMYDSSGNCVPHTTIDLCSNIAGNQTTIPSGMVVNTGGQCVPPAVPDACPNIDGTQLRIPSDMTYDTQGNCVPLMKIDACPNIAGTQTTLPKGMSYDSQGNCVASLCLTNPKLCAPPADACSVDPASCVSPASFCTTHPELCVPPPTCKGLQCLSPGYIKSIINNLTMLTPIPFAKRASSIMITAGIISGIALSLVTSVFTTPTSLSDIFNLPVRLWSLLLSALGFKKRRRPWGTVYDSVTKEPLDPAYVALLDLQGKEVATSITDIDGRYGFLAPAGQYRMVAHKTNYLFPSDKMKDKSSDELYEDLYFGDIINVNEDEGVIIKNIPMDAINFDWNEFAKQDQRLMKFYSRRDIWIVRISSALFYFGLLLTIIAVVGLPNVYNIATLVAYMVLLVFKNVTISPSSLGTVVFSENGNPVSFAIMRIFRADDNYEVAHKIVNKTGKYYCIVPNGTYYVEIEKKNLDATYSLIYTSGPIIVKKGHINNKFKV
ncbi:MAG: carboxypeptidase regulatory-like domain-containing protein [Patescibacteria group bacterium]|nr:carboxypeptidase regulatory-like domain-containing protein [Patescibacteria group bacterium]